MKSHFLLLCGNGCSVVFGRGFFVLCFCLKFVYFRNSESYIEHFLMFSKDCGIISSNEIKQYFFLPIKLSETFDEAGFYIFEFFLPKT